MTHQIAQTILPGARRSFEVAQAMMKGIDPAAASRFPNGVTTNHPTFVYGHLSIYPDRIFTMFGRADLAQPDARLEELFSPFAECQDDPFSSIYPDFDTVCTRYTDRTQAVLAFLESAPDQAFLAPSDGPMAHVFPTAGSLAAFLVQAHTMMHLGQISAWRRVMGMGEAMPRPQKR